VTGGAVIAVQDLTKRFSTGVIAVDHLSFSVAPGEVCGLLGPNGAGKTTTLRILLGLVRPSAGSVELLGARVTSSTPELARVGVMIEQAAFVPYLSGRVNLRLWWESGGGRWPAPGLDLALDLAGLGPAVDRAVRTYSLGMHQRLGLARALLNEPTVLVLDEPTIGLDPQEMRSVRALLRSVANEGVTVLLSSHLLAEVEEVCSHVVVMDRGRLVASGTVAELVSRTGQTVYIEVDDVNAARAVLQSVGGLGAITQSPPGLAIEINGASRSEIVAALVHAGVGVETVMARHRLEDAFMDLLGEDTMRQ
jgi:ABC-2 type transport system ATP-binding protein